MSEFSRRAFVTWGGLLASGMAVGQAPADKLTAGGVIGRIKEHVGVPWLEKTVDRVVWGSADTPVTGIATTMMATLDVIERSVAEGKNMIVTHEPTFYLHQDTTDDIRDDATLAYKQDYMKKHNVVVFRFHDHWHMHTPDGIAQGMVQQLGWQTYVDDPANPQRLTFPGMPLAAFVKQMATTLHATTIRVVGDPALPVRKVQASWGYMARERGIPALAKPDVDVLICGETREWELVEYAQDSITAGNKKALIVVGHVLSEQGGMILCADWLKGFVKEVPVGFVAAKEAFWSASAV